MSKRRRGRWVRAGRLEPEFPGDRRAIRGGRWRACLRSRPWKIERLFSVFYAGHELLEALDV